MRLQELFKITEDSRMFKSNVQAFSRPSKDEEQQILASLPRTGDLPTMKELENDPSWFEFVEA